MLGILKIILLFMENIKAKKNTDNRPWKKYNQISRSVNYSKENKNRKVNRDYTKLHINRLSINPLHKLQYSYCIDKGNNHQLIQKLLEKRNWWV